MVSHMTSIVLLFALFLGLAECAKCPYAKFTPQHSFCKDPNPKCTILERGLQPAHKQEPLGQAEHVFPVLYISPSSQLPVGP
uniref:U11-Eretoxin-Ek1i_1 n=1 Tax=Eresus cinnaberinus TaxID=175337 RepID=A0A2D0PE05_ERECI